MKEKLNHLMLILLLIVTLSYSDSFGVSANINNDNHRIGNQDSGVISKDALNHYTQSGAVNVITYTPCISSGPCIIEEIHIANIIRYAQSGESWSSNIMQSCGITIGSAGCAVTSLAMINRKYNAIKNPGQVNTILGSAACPLAWSTAASRLSLSYEKLFQHSTGVHTSYVHNTLRGVLRNGKPVLLGLKKLSGVTHYVVVKYYFQLDNGEYTFGVSDPGISNRTSLKQLMNDGWKIIQIHVYY